MQTPSKNSPPGWRIIIIGPHRTSNCVTKVHRVARALLGCCYSLSPPFKHVRRDDCGCPIVVEFSGNNFDFQVMCLYAPNSRDEGHQFFESLYHSIDPDIPIVMCGDLMQRSILMSIALDATLYPPGQTIGPPLIDS